MLFRFTLIHPKRDEQKFKEKIGFTGNLYDTGYGYGSKEMRSIGVLKIRPTKRYKVNPHLGAVLAGL